MDEILVEIGEYGRYQKFVLWFILLPGVFPCGFHAYNQLFMAGTPEHWCKIEELQRFDVHLVRNLSIPRTSMLKFSQCLMYDLNYTSTAFDFYKSLNHSSVSTISCKWGWHYDKKNYEKTIVTEWNLVCDKDFYPTLSLVLFAFGGLLGNYFCGYIQDRIGRKPAFFIFLSIQCISGIVTSLATDFGTWLLCRIGVGFTIPAILNTPYVLAIELVGPKYRTWVTILVNVAYSMALVLLSLIVYMVRDWRILSLSTTLPFLGLFVYLWYLPESPRWLLTQGKVTETVDIIAKIAKYNGKHIPNQVIYKMLKDNIKNDIEHRQYGLSDLLRLKNLRWKTIIITFIWFSNTSVYVGLSYYAPILGGNEYLNFFLAGAVELPTYFFLYPAMEQWGRRWILFSSMLIGGVACLCTFLVPNTTTTTLLILYCIGKIGISSSFVVLPLFASELYPTVVRGLGMNLSSMLGMVGPVLIPLVNYLGSDMLTLPLVVMGTMLVLGGGCALFLPETLNKHLPQTLQDAEHAEIECFACVTPPQCQTGCPTREINLSELQANA